MATGGKRRASGFKPSGGGCWGHGTRCPDPCQCHCTSALHTDPTPLRGAGAEPPNHPQRLLLSSPAPLLSSPAPAADKQIKYIITTSQLTHCPQESARSPCQTPRSPEQPPSPQGMQVLLLHHPKTRLDPPQGPRGRVIPGGQAGTAASPSPWGALPDRAKRSKEPSSALPAQNLILH